MPGKAGRTPVSLPFGSKRFQNVGGKDEQERQDEDFRTGRLRKEKPPEKDGEKYTEDRSNAQNPPAHTLPFPTRSLRSPNSRGTAFRLHKPGPRRDLVVRLRPHDRQILSAPLCNVKPRCLARRLPLGV